MHNELSFIPLGGIGDITKNMYIYEYQNQILIVDCGLGFADETMLGVDLLLPDISYLVKSGGKKIAGMILTHGHEDHIGALPFILPQLRFANSFPIYGSPFTASLANEKLKEFNTRAQVMTVPFEKNEVVLGVFRVSFIRVTHSVPDSANLFIRTPAGNFYHGSDFKFDQSPADGKKSDYAKITQAGQNGVACLLSDCLGAERLGRTPTEAGISEYFANELRQCKRKFIVTTYSSSIARINQIIKASQDANRKVCFIGRSLIKTKEVAIKLGYLRIRSGMEISIEQIKHYPDNKLTLIVAGSQGQEESAMARIATGVHKEVKIGELDTVIFSADPIPGNEVLVYELVDTIAKTGARVLYSSVNRNFHVSGHASTDELMELIKLVKPKKLIPIGGAFRHMVAYRNLALSLGYKKSDVLLLEDGQEIIFSKDGTRPGRVIPIKNVYVDEISGEEVESFVLRDRQKLSEGGIVIILAEIDAGNGQLLGKPDLIIRGFTIENNRFHTRLLQDIKAALGNRGGRVTNLLHLRKLIGQVVERRIFKDLKRRPLVLPIVIEV